MTTLIPIHQTACGMDTVNARDLHAFLEVGKDFTSWIKGRIDQYGFRERSDYNLTLTKTGERRNVTRSDYHITLDMAKELSMVERNTKGKAARQYFIDCERRAKQAPSAPALPDFQNPAIAARAWADQHERADQAETLLAEAAPKLDTYAQLLDSDGSFCLRDAAKLVGVKPKELIDYLSTKGWIYRQAQKGPWIGYQAKIISGLLEHKVNFVTRTDGSERSVSQVRVTEKGVARLASLLAPAEVEVAA